MKDDAGSRPDSKRRWPPQQATVDPALLDLTRQVVLLARAKLPRGQRLAQLKLLKTEITKLQARQEARANARAAIVKAAEALLRACAADPDDEDLGVLHSMLELMLRAASGAKGDLFAHFRRLVGACDEEVGLGLVSLHRTGATRGGGSNDQLAQRLAALLERIVREGVGAFQAAMEEATGIASAALQSGKANRFQVAACLAHYLRAHFDPKASLQDAANRVYTFMPTNGNARFRDTAGKFREEVYAEDPKATVAAFRAYGVKSGQPVRAQRHAEGAAPQTPGRLLLTDRYC